MRLAVLSHFSANPREWKVVFTSGATASLKLVGEQFPWSPEGVFVHARDSHNSVLGVREYARAAGAGVRCVDLDDFEIDSSRSHSCLLDRLVEPTVYVGGCACSCSCSCGGGGGRSHPLRDSDASVSGACTPGRSDYHGGIGLEDERDQSRSNNTRGTTEEGMGCCSHNPDQGKDDRYGCREVAGSGVRQRTAGMTKDGGRDRGLKVVWDSDDNPAAASVVYDNGIQGYRTGNSDSGRSHGREDDEGVVDCLFAFPAECNATGARPHLSIAGIVKRCGDHDPSNCHLCRNCACGGRACGNSGNREDLRMRSSSRVERGENSAHNCSGNTTTSVTGATDMTANGASNPITAAPEAEAAAEACQFGGASEGTACVGERRRRWRISRRKRRWWVMLDAAKFVGTAPLDLSKVEADFVALSFYKMFG